jgi:hypothetical protein
MLVSCGELRVPASELVRGVKIDLAISSRRFVSSLLAFLAGTAAITCATVKARAACESCRRFFQQCFPACVCFFPVGEVVQLVERSPSHPAFFVTTLISVAYAERG